MDQTFTNWWVDIVQEYGSFECSLGDINIYILIYSVSVSWSSQETSHWHLPRQQDDAEPQSQAGDADSTILQPIVSYPLLGFFTFFFNMENPSVQSVMAVLHGFPMRFGHGLAPEGSQSEQGLGQGLSCSMRTCTCIYFSFFFFVCVWGPKMVIWKCWRTSCGVAIFPNPRLDFVVFLVGVHVSSCLCLLRARSSKQSAVISKANFC